MSIDFKGSHYLKGVILYAVFFYVRYAVDPRHNSLISVIFRLNNVEGTGVDALKILQARPDLFFRVSGIGLADFTTLVAALEPVWRKQEHKRLSRAEIHRKRPGKPAG